MCATSVPILCFPGLSASRVTPEVRDRRQTKASLNASALWERHNNKTCKQVKNIKDNAAMRRRLMQVHYMIIQPAIGEICVLQDIKVALLYIRVKAVKLDITITVFGSEFSGMLPTTVHSRY